MCLTDLEGIVDYEVVARTAGMLAKHGHQLSVRVLEEPPLGQGDALQQGLAAVRARAQRRRFSEARRYLGRLGIEVTPARYTAARLSPMSQVGR